MAIDRKTALWTLSAVAAAAGCAVLLWHLRAAAPPGPGWRVKGPSAAPIVIEEYTDLQCPACRKANEFLKRLEEIYPAAIRITFRHNPLPMHKWSAAAAAAADCAGRQGKFFEYADALFAGQPDWAKTENPSAVFDDYAGKTGLDVSAFRSCRAMPEAIAAVKREGAYAEKRGIDSTPTFIINGKTVSGTGELAQAAAEFEQIIRNSGKR
ncbi:MAG: thioredoxin domain-containing protein [Elusimicrobiales bacterium]|nr:thioredoxin domain-containing protein [Elusimicrobiales bacterium]